MTALAAVNVLVTVADPALIAPGIEAEPAVKALVTVAVPAYTMAAETVPAVTVLVMVADPALIAPVIFAAVALIVPLTFR